MGGRGIGVGRVSAERVGMGGIFFSRGHQQNNHCFCLFSELSGKSKGGLSKGGLGPKGANWAKKGPFGAISALPPWLWGAEELVPIGPEKAPIGPEKVPICPEKARFRRKDFPPIFSENLGLKPPFVGPPSDFPKKGA